jgi:hypothetical protein
VKRRRKKTGEVKKKKDKNSKNKWLGDWVYSFLVKIVLNPIIKTNIQSLESRLVVNSSFVNMLRPSQRL